MVVWNQTDHCCRWSGVGCDGAGRVTSLRLDNEAISGGVGDSSSLFRLRYMSELYLSSNDFNTSKIPRKIHLLTKLRHLDLSGAGFMGPIPSTLANLTHLVYLDLSSNFLTASIPSFHMCNQLEWINLSYNNLMGPLSHLHFEGLANLCSLDVSHDALSGTIPHHLFALPSIDTLYLSNNQFSGQINEFPILNHSNLVCLDLSSNRIEGPIPNSFFQLQSLYSLRLSDNLFNGTFQLRDVQSLPSLTQLALSYNNLSVETTNMSSSSGAFPQLYYLHLSSCNLCSFPDLRDQSSLSVLDLSNNRIGGDIPSWIWEIGITSMNLSLNLLTDLQRPYRIRPFQLLDLHSNRLRCEFPFLPQATQADNSTAFLLLANNSLAGAIPTSICNTYPLVVLDLSFNNLSGSIPHCLLRKSIVLDVLNLRGNNISGVIPDQFSGECGLRTFDVSNNNLGGKIPKSLANCKELVVMNVGNNFDDGFPCMLPLSLRILVLRSNRFHGEFRCHESWPELQILDVSSNHFNGTLHPLDFTRWRGMMLESHAHLRTNRSNSNFLSANDFYRDEVTITVKTVEVKLVKIWPDFTSIDLSCNGFQGDIPHAIGDLDSLYLLNLSHNALTGAIPRSLGALAELDLSANRLTGRIPEELTRLTFLSILDVSHNVTGMIPNGPQLQTFSADSFDGNAGLCGFPLDRSCSKIYGGGLTAPELKDEEIEWGYVFAALGYVVGLGSIAWTLLCWKNFRVRYLEKVDEVVDKMFDRRDMRIRQGGERRRVERRNEVRRR